MTKRDLIHNPDPPPPPLRKRKSNIVKLSDMLRSQYCAFFLFEWEMIMKIIIITNSIHIWSAEHFTWLLCIISIIDLIIRWMIDTLRCLTAGEIKVKCFQLLNKETGTFQDDMKVKTKSKWRSGERGGRSGLMEWTPVKGVTKEGGSGSNSFIPVGVRERQACQTT